MIKPGLSSNLRVLRKTDIGYMLTDDEIDEKTKRLKEVFLHFNECLNQELKENDEVLAFIYYDSQKRPSATLRKPIITQYNPGWVKVISKTNFGVFIDNNLSKDILIDEEYLPYDKNKWPNENDLLYCILRPKGNTLIAKIVNEYDSEDYKTDESFEVGDSVYARVTKILKSGIALYTEGLTYIFVHNTNLRRDYRLGEEVLVTITKVTDERIDGTLIKNKEFMIDDDSNKVLEYLKQNKEMPYGNDSSPEDIYKVFKMSKKAFKRALGHLYKERKIYFEDNKTILK